MRKFQRWAGDGQVIRAKKIFLAWREKIHLNFKVGDQDQKTYFVPLYCNLIATSLIKTTTILRSQRLISNISEKLLLFNYFACSMRVFIILLNVNKMVDFQLIYFLQFEILYWYKCVNNLNFSNSFFFFRNNLISASESIILPDCLLTTHEL